MTINTYEVKIEHPRLSEPLVMELIASSERAAIGRARGHAMHMYAEVELFTAECSIVTMVKGVWPFGNGVSIHGATAWCGPGCEPAAIPAVHSSEAHAAAVLDSRLPRSTGGSHV